MQSETIDVLPEPVFNDVDERRRPGRSEIAPSLVPLLRLSSDGTASYEAMRRALDRADGAASVYGDGAEALAPARGFLVALCMVTPFWFLVAGLVYYIV